MHFLCRTIPIYWGDPLIVKEFNPNAFIHVKDENCFGSVIQKIRRLENDIHLMLDMLNQPVFNDRDRYLEKIRNRAQQFFCRNFFKTSKSRNKATQVRLGDGKGARSAKESIGLASIV